MKTYKEWLNSEARTIYEYLTIDDEVDKNMIDYFRNIIPPLICNFKMLQVGESSDYINGKATYMTFKRENGKWIFKGDCFKNGDVQNETTI